MSGEKYFLDLTGRPLDGYRTEAVAAALARLLRIPRKNARNLLRESHHASSGSLTKRRRYT